MSIVLISIVMIDRITVQKQKSVADMKQEAFASDAPPRRIVAEMMGKMTDEALTNLPQRDALRRTIQRKRKRDDAFPSLPQHFEGFEIPDKFRNTTVGGSEVRFLLHDTGDVNEDNDKENGLKRIILFATDEMLTFMTGQSD